MKAMHEGMWVPAGDPEVPTQCKTTGVALYDNTTVYPLYAASSRVLGPPSFLDPDVAMTVARAASEDCACAADECCLGGQASFFTGALISAVSQYRGHRRCRQQLLRRSGEHRVRDGRAGACRSTRRTRGS